MDNGHDRYIINLDEYKQKKKIGSGSYADVFLVKNKQTDKLYAAKINKGDDELSSSLDEAIILINMDNPAILKIYGYSLKDFEGEENFTTILDYMPHGSLYETIKQKNPPSYWTPTKMYINLLGIAIGMKYLHSQNTVHRDLKPLNVLLDENYYPCICDFGFAKRLDKLGSKNLLKTGVGTIIYMAPEILSNSPYDYTVDVYSYGVLAYELITRQNMFPTNVSLIDFINGITDGKRPDISMLDPDIARFIDICWSNNPSERPNFSQIVEILEDQRFYSKFDVDVEGLKKYLELFDDEQLNENPTDDLMTSQELSTNSITELSASNSIIDNILFYENLVNEVFNQHILTEKCMNEILSNEPDQLLITTETIQDYISKKLYDEFIPTISFKLNKPLKEIDYNNLQEILGKDAVIINVESSPTNLQIALLSIEDFNSDFENMLDNFVEELKLKLEIDGDAKIRVPDDNDIIKVFSRPSIKHHYDLQNLDMNKIRQVVLQRLQKDKSMYNWKFIFEHEDLYNQMDKKINDDLMINPYELYVVNKTLFPNKSIDEYNKVKSKIPEDEIVECFLYNGSALKETNNGFFGKGFYATSNPYFAAMIANDEKPLKLNETIQIICYTAIFNKTKTNELKSAINNKTIDTETRKKFGINYAIVGDSTGFLPVNSNDDKSTIIAEEFVFPNKIQLVPLCSFTVIRRDHCIIWKDERIKETDINAIFLRKLSKEKEINTYFMHSNEEALKIIKNKKYASFKLITSGGGSELLGKNLIVDARNIIGSRFVCLVFATNIELHMDWISKMKNVLFASVDEYFQAFAQLDMNLKDILDFESKLKQDYAAIFKGLNVKPWNIEKNELLSFQLCKDRSSSTRCNLA